MLKDLQRLTLYRLYYQVTTIEELQDLISVMKLVQLWNIVAITMRDIQIYNRFVLLSLQTTRLANFKQIQNKIFDRKITLQSKIQRA